MEGKNLAFLQVSQQPVFRRVRFYHSFSMFLLIAGLGLCDAAVGLSESQADPVLRKDEKVSIWSYTKAFAKRFNLPEMADEGLPQDVWAMEFRILRDKYSPGKYACLFNTYLNNKLDLFYPEGEVGSRRIPDVNERFPQGGKFSNTEDRVFHGNQSGQYSTKVYFFSKSQKVKPNKGGGAFYEEYRKFFLPDLAYLSFSVGCDSVGDPDEYEVWWWVEKAGGRDYRHWTKPDPNDFHQFHLPKSFVARFYRYAKLADGLNSCVAEFERKRRFNSKTPEYWEKREKECSELRKSRVKGGN